MNNFLNSSFSKNENLFLALEIVQDYLHDFTKRTDYLEVMIAAFRDNLRSQDAISLAQAWQAGDFSVIPAIQILSDDELNGANGAFAIVTNTIYLSERFLRNADLNCTHTIKSFTGS